MIFKLKYSLMVLVFFGLTVQSVSGVYAAYGSNANKTNNDTAPTELSNPLGSDPKMTDVNFVIGKIINSVLGVVGTIALAMFIYGGLRWMTSAGEKDGVIAGKETIKWATFGLIIIFMAYAIINFVLKDILMQG